LPFCSWLFGRFARLAFPIPELLVVASTVFLFDESFTIYGGNIASTMAGEFSFSIALAFSIFGFGVFMRGLETASGRVASSVLLALAALCHGIVLLFAFTGYLLILAMHREAAKWRFGLPVIGTAVLLSAFWVVPFVLNHAFMTDMKYEPQPAGAGHSSGSSPQCGAATWPAHGWASTGCCWPSVSSWLARASRSSGCSGTPASFRSSTCCATC
jgi:hypothetical protein